ncbi:hypothetical protein ACTXT7_004265 [Hymenolepis weldensis]
MSSETDNSGQTRKSILKPKQVLDGQFTEIQQHIEIVVISLSKHGGHQFLIVNHFVVISDPPSKGREMDFQVAAFLRKFKLLNGRFSVMNIHYCVNEQQKYL